MKKLEILSRITMLLAMLSMGIGVAVIDTLDTHAALGSNTLERYSWILYCTIPLCIPSLIVSRLLKRKGLPHRDNVLVAYIMIPVLIFFGSARFIFQESGEYDPNVMYRAEQALLVDLPEDVEFANWFRDTHTITRVRLDPGDENDAFLESVQNDGRWIKNLPEAFKTALPLTTVEWAGNDYFIFYNETLNEFNTYPQAEGEYTCFMMLYDVDRAAIIIMSDYLLRVE